MRDILKKGSEERSPNGFIFFFSDSNGTGDWSNHVHVM